MPLKEKLFHVCGIVSDHARAIGAINTLTKEVHRTTRSDGTVRTTETWIGDNTDWLALKDVLQLILKKAGSKKRSLSIAVLGTGGTSRAACYTLQQLKLPFTIMGRNLTKLKLLQEEFLGMNVLEYSFTPAFDSELAKTFDLVISTVPPEVAVPEDLYTNLVDFGYGGGNARARTVCGGLELLVRQAEWQQIIWRGAEGE